MGILSGKVAIVTGAGRGLGVAEAMAKEGAETTVCLRNARGGSADRGRDPALRSLSAAREAAHA